MVSSVTFKEKLAGDSRNANLWVMHLMTFKLLCCYLVTDLWAALLSQPDSDACMSNVTGGTQVHRPLVRKKGNN